MLKKILQLVFLILGVAMVSGPAEADIITLKNEQTYEGKITAEEEARVQIRLEGSGARLWFSRDQILSLEKTESDEGDEQGKAASTGDSPPALDDDVARAQEMLEEMRKQTKPRQYKKKERPEPSTTGPKAKKPSTTQKVSDEEVEKLVDIMINGSDIFARAKAVQQLGEVGATSAIPDLIHALDDKKNTIRHAANKSLIQITDQNFGFNSGAQRSVRLFAIERWEDWYKEIKRDDAKKTLKSWF